jgi:hypothetical protein
LLQGDFILIEIENSFRGGGFQEGTRLSNIKMVTEKITWGNGSEGRRNGIYTKCDSYHPTASRRHAAAKQLIHCIERPKMVMEGRGWSAMLPNNIKFKEAGYVNGNQWKVHN